MPTAMVWLNLVISATGILLSLALAIAVLRANPDRRSNRFLAGVLLLQGGLQAVLITGVLRPDLVSYDPIVLATDALLCASAVAFLLFCGTLATPWTRPLRTRPGRVIIAGVGLLVIASDYIALARGVDLEAGLTDGIAWVILGIASIAALVFTIDAYRRTPVSSPAHKRSLSYMLAFGSRDAILGGSIVLWALTEFGPVPEVGKEIAQFSGGVALLLFVPLLAYGILSTQLFDVDLKIKVGISRGTVASIALAVVFIISKIVEAYASRNLGFVAGAVAAGILLFAAPRLNKLGDKVANTAMPAVQPTSEYVAYKKLEVYRAAVESALEGNSPEIDKAERAMLDRLRAKLGLSEADARALEEEVATT